MNNHANSLEQQTISTILDRVPEWECYEKSHDNGDLFGVNQCYLDIYKLGDIQKPRCSVNLIHIVRYTLLEGEFVLEYLRGKHTEIIHSFYVLDPEKGNLYRDPLSASLAYSNEVSLTDMALFQGDPYERRHRSSLFPRQQIIENQIKKGQLILLPKIYSSIAIFEQGSKEFKATADTMAILDRKYQSLLSIGSARKHKHGWVWHKLFELDDEIQSLWSALGYFLPINNLVWSFVFDYREKVFPILHAAEMERIVNRNYA